MKIKDLKKSIILSTPQMQSLKGGDDDTIVYDLDRTVE